VEPWALRRVISAASLKAAATPASQDRPIESTIRQRA
jgi:hypothetical protein